MRRGTGTAAAGAGRRSALKSGTTGAGVLAVWGALLVLTLPLWQPPAAARPATPGGAAAGSSASRVARPLRGDAGQGPAVVAGEVLVRFRSGAPGVQRLRAVAAVGVREGRGPGTGVHRVAVRRGGEEQAAATLARQPGVAWAQPNYLRFPLTHTAAEPAEAGWGVRALAAHHLWDRDNPVTGAGVRVAVVDSGVATHPQLSAALVSRRWTGFRDHEDRCGHGTAVASVVAAARDGRDVVGVAPHAEIIAVKVLEYESVLGACAGDDATIAKGIRWAASPTGGAADVVNLSLGGPVRSRLLAEAIADARAAGALVVAAAGNTGDRLPSYPAGEPAVLSVGALRRSVNGPVPARFSSFGKVDVAAPGAGIPVVVPGGTAWRLNATPCGDHVCVSGTSFAAPHVTGALALLRERHAGRLDGVRPAVRERRLRQWLLGTARDLVRAPAAAGADLRTGHGLPNLPAAADVEPAAVLATWLAQRRTIAPHARLRATPTTTGLRLTLSDGRGRALQRLVSLDADRRTTTTPRTDRTDSSGRVRLVATSTRDGAATRVVADYGEGRLGLQLYVLARDDNVEGRRLPSGRHVDQLDYPVDFDDVWRVWLRGEETLRARLHDTGARWPALYLFHDRTTDVTDFDQLPLREDTRSAESDPLFLRRTVREPGPYYLDVVGLGAYALTWSIESPGMLRRLEASPVRLRWSTRVSWYLPRAGRVRAVVRDDDGRVVRRRSFGREPAGVGVWRWGGRHDDGRRLPTGRYRIMVRWQNGDGRWARHAVVVRIVGT